MREAGFGEMIFSYAEFQFVPVRDPDNYRE
jgi:hypothetical protein